MQAVGWTRDQVRSLVRRELLFSAHAGVFFLSADPSRLAVWTAAVARCGIAALLSHWSAAALWRLIERDYGWPHVTVPRDSMRKVKGIRLHETTRATERCERSLVPVTSLTRTIENCSMTMTPQAIKRMLRQAEYHHSLELSLLADTRSRKLKEVLRLYVPGQGKTESELEAAFFELSHRAGLPTPLLQRPIPGGRADFTYESLQLIVEVDGYDPHRGRIAFREDRTRDRANLARGYLTLRFTWEDVMKAPETVIADLRRHARSPSAKGT